MLNQSERTKLVKEFYESLYQKVGSSLTAKNVPEEMRIGPADKDGYSNWKLIPAHVTEADFQALEKQIGCVLPPLVKTFFSTYYYFFCDSQELIALDEGPDNPFEIILDLQSTIDSQYDMLVNAGLLPLLMPSSSIDEFYCIDLSNMPDEDACPILYFHLYELDDDMDREEILSSAAEPVWDNFQAFLEYCIKDVHPKL